MTNYAITLHKRDGHKKASTVNIKPNEMVLYEGAAANNNWIVKFWINKNQTQAANSDTITITLA